MSFDPNRESWTVEELADIFGKSPATLRRLIGASQIVADGRFGVEPAYGIQAAEAIYYRIEDDRRARKLARQAKAAETPAS